MGMIKEISQQKNFSKIGQNIQKPKLPSAQTVKQNAASSVRSPASLAAFAGLPSDKLSASIVSIARFFFLPLKPQLLADIRRQAFTAEQAESKQTGGKHIDAGQVETKPPSMSVSHNDTKNKQALVLAACAAESKSVELLPKGLESYAEAVDPGREKHHEGEKRHDKNEQRHNEENTEIKTASVNPSELKKIALNSSENNPLLYILNRLNGKNGQRWIVFPFDFSQNGKQMRVSMRILLDEERIIDRSVLMAVDIQFKNTDDEDERQLFIFESVNDKISKLTACFESESILASEKKLKSELSKQLNIKPEKIFFKTLSEDFSCEAELEKIPALDKAV